MLDSILVTYASPSDPTFKVALVIKETLQDAGFKVDLSPLKEVHTLEGYYTVILGGPFFLSHWHHDALRFISKHRKELHERYVAAFTLGSVQTANGSNSGRQNLYARFDKELKRFPWLSPLSLGVFSNTYGQVNPHFPFNLFLVTEPINSQHEWAIISAWANNLAGKIIHAGKNLWADEVL